MPKSCQIFTRIVLLFSQQAGPAAEPVEAVEAAEAELEAEPQEEVVVQVGGQVVPGLGLGLGLGRIMPNISVRSLPTARSRVRVLLGWTFFL